LEQIVSNESQRNMLGMFITLFYTHTMPINHYCSKSTSLRWYLMAKCCLRVGRKSESEARNLPPCGCKSMTDGPRNMLRMFITLFYTHTMPINHYCSKPTSLRWYLMAKCRLRLGRKSESEARNLPPCGCKSMVDGPRNMLGVFITLFYTHTMPNNHYCSNPTSLRCHLMTKCYLRVGKKSRSEA